ncbi:hypothetical protein [Dongia sedimenti]|uniref:Uncharacterized protein n=1 Tax=Dongia sedimenti TaxID=3064282 RepID=A0ABU0YJK2_9PROT|nr:hypothetical protein [Rhodospirillaceae bacterium R-7]
MHWPRYLWKAFNARPFGMPVPPLWFAVIASGLIGYFIAPPLAMIGLGATAMFTGILASSKRFRTTVDAPLLQAPIESEQSALLRRLDPWSRERHAKIEEQCQELQKVLETARAGQQHIAGVWQLAGLHLKLLVARTSAVAVTENRSEKGQKSLAEQLDDVKKRLGAEGLDGDLKETLEDQQRILAERIGMRAEAARRIDVLDAELERIRDQMALMRDQALLSSDPASIGRSVDGLAAFLNESGRWLKDQEDIFGEIGDLETAPYVSTLSDSAKQRNSKRVGESQ